MLGKKNTEQPILQINQKPQIIQENQPLQYQHQYNDLSQIALIKKIRMKDQIINDLKKKLKNLSNDEKNKTTTYQEMLEDFMNHNEKSVHIFEFINKKIIEIISIFVGSSIQLQHMHLFIHQFSKSSQADIIIKKFQFVQNSEFNYLQDITIQSTCLLDYLNKLINSTVHQNVDLKNQITLARQQITELNQKMLNLAKSQPQIKVEVKIKPQPFPQLQLFPILLSPVIVFQPEQQIKLQKKLCNELILENQHFRKLLNQCQLQKSKLLKSIATVVSQQTIKKLLNLNKMEIIEQVKKMAFRIRELEREKEQIYNRLHTQNKMNQKRFQDLLKEVKQIKSPIQSY